MTKRKRTFDGVGGYRALSQVRLPTASRLSLADAVQIAAHETTVPMLQFELKDLLQAVGTTASLIFASWIFLSFLQSRYTSTYDRYRALIAELRGHGQNDRRRASLLNQILLYKKRCEQMKRSTNIGVLSAIILTCSVMAAGLGTIFGGAAVWKAVSAVTSLGGLLLVIVAASIVIRENSDIQRAIDEELSDVPELANRPDQAAAQRHRKAA